MSMDMRTRLKFRRAVGLAATVAFLGSLSASAASQWVAIGPEGGSVRALAFDASGPQTIYAGLDEGGVWRSEDGGLHWVEARAGMPPGTLVALAADPDSSGTLYAGRLDGVWKSGDGGRSWSLAAGTLGGEPVSVASLLVDPSANRLYAGLNPISNQAPLWWSADGGATWTAFDLHLGGSSVTALARDAGHLYAGTTAEGVFRNDSPDSPGSAWSHPFEGLAIRALATTPGSLYVATSDRLLVSHDFGATSQVLLAAAEVPPGSPPSSLSLASLALAADAPDRIYVGYTRFDGETSRFISGLQRSTDGGATFSVITSGFPDLAARALLVAPQGVFAGPGTLGVWSSPDGANGWTASNHGLRAAPVLRVLADPKRAGFLYAGVADQGLFRSVNSGLTWQPANLGSAQLQPAAIDPEQPANLYAFGSDVGSLYKSRNGGRAWSRLPVGALSLTLDPRHPKTLFAGYPGGFSNPLSRSDDGGATWRQATVSCTFPNHLAVSPTGEVYVGGNSFCGIQGSSLGGVDRSTDGGKTFINRRTGLGALPVPFSLAVDPNRPATLYGGFSTLLTEPDLHPVRGLFRSRDRADHWELVPIAGLGSPVVDVLFPPGGPSTIWLASNGSGIWRSGDAGESFRAAVIPGLPTLGVNDLELDGRSPAVLYVGTAGGLFQLQ